MTLRIKIPFLLILFFLASCSGRQKREVNDDNSGKYLNLDYEVLSKQNLFPNDNIEFYSGYIVFTIPDRRILEVDLAETIKQIGIKENLISAKIFDSRTGYLMETDSIPISFVDYYKSYIGDYDLTNKGLNWKHIFKITDIRFKGVLPIKIDVK
jgi:hypothetical protein